MTGIRGKGVVIPRKLISKDGTFSTLLEDYGDKLSNIDLFTLQDFRKYAQIFLKSSYILSKLLINFQIVFAKNLIFTEIFLQLISESFEILFRLLGWCILQNDEKSKVSHKLFFIIQIWKQLINIIFASISDIFMASQIFFVIL